MSTDSEHVAREGFLDRIPAVLRPYIVPVIAWILLLDLTAVVLFFSWMKALGVVVFFFLVLMVAAAWSGYGPGILLFGLTFFALQPIVSPGRPQRNNRIGMAVFLAIQVAVSFLAARKRRTEASLRQRAEVLESQVKENTSELSRHEQTLREQAHLLDLASDAILTRDSAGAIRFWSRGATVMYGWTEEEALGKNAEQLFAPVSAETRAAMEAKLLAKGFWEGEATNERRDGGKVIVMTRWALRRDKTGAPCGTLEINSDITERRRTEQQLQQAQKMESIGLLAGGVAHDFNNLLTIINGYAEMALMDTPADSPLGRELVQISEAGNRAANLTKQLLAFGRKQMVQPAVLNLNTIVGGLQSMLQRLIGEHIEVVTRLEPNLANVKADSGQLEQIIVNLAVNARDAMPRGGRLLLETANVTFDESYAKKHPEVKGGPFAMLAVTDSGTGITPEIQARMFEPFFTTKPKESGTGLGLSTVYGMVKQNGGWVWVYSEPGQGATFKVYLPQTSGKAEAVRPIAKSDLHGNEFILVVEDQAEVRDVAVASLERYGYRVHGAARASEALAMQDLGKIDLLLTDVVMPGMSGGDLARQLLQTHPKLRIIFTSGYTEGSLEEHVGFPGAAFLQKPFTPEVLAEKVRDVLGPKPSAPTALLVHHDGADPLRAQLIQAGFAVVEARTTKQALELAGQTHIDLVVTEASNGQEELTRSFVEKYPNLRVIGARGTQAGPELLNAMLESLPRH